MKSSRVMKIFEQYVKKFDMNNTNIKAKYFHSLKTMELAREIATNLRIFSEEEIVVCELIGLFHEIGCFDKNPDFHIMNDNSEDYTNKTSDDMSQYIKNSKKDSVKLLIKRNNEEKEINIINFSNIYLTIFLLLLSFHVTVFYLYATFYNLLGYLQC